MPAIVRWSRSSEWRCRGSPKSSANTSGGGAGNAGGPSVVDRLPEPYREALRLTDLGALAQAEAAARLGISASGMRTRVQRGRVRLRALFDACCRFEVDARGGVVAYEGRCSTDC